MNICTPGNCICDAAEWPGDTNCMGEVEGADPWAVQLDPNWDPRYYFDTALGVTLCVSNPSEMEPNRQYFLDPDLTKPA